MDKKTCLLGRYGTVTDAAVRNKGISAKIYIMKKTSLVKLYTGLFTIGCMAVGCGKMDANYANLLKGGEARYPAKPDSIRFFTGHNRAQLSWLMISAATVVQCRVYWNDRADSVTVPFKATSADGEDTVNVIIEDIPEGSYTFQVFTYDKNGNRSILKDVGGHVFGQNYVNTLTNRQIKSAEKFTDKAKIEWFQPGESSLATEISYIDKDGASRERIIPNTENISYIMGIPGGDTIRYRTLYLPDSLSIDTFYSAYQAVLLEMPVAKALDKRLFKEVPLPSDAPQYNSSENPMKNLWDDNKDSWFRTANGSGSPHWYTFDLGVTATLTSYTAWQRGAFLPSEYWLLYANADPLRWEIWGSVDPAPDGSWEGWTKLLDCTGTKPSGSPLNQVADEDILYAQSGQQFDFPPGIQPVRYIRIKVFQTWDPGASDRSFFGELTFFGIAE